MFTSLDSANDDFVNRLNAGDPQALEELIIEFTPLLRRWANKELTRRRVPANQWWTAPSDVIQSVWLTFYQKRLASHPWESVHHIRRYIQGMVRNVVRTTIRDQHCARRDVSLEVALDEAIQTGDDALLRQVAGPPDLAGAGEVWKILYRHVSPARHALLNLLRSGHSVAETASITGLCEKTVRRFVQGLRTEAAAGLASS